MGKLALLLVLTMLAGCGGGGEEAGGLTADERERLENIAERLDEEQEEVRELLEEPNAIADNPPPAIEETPGDSGN